MCDWESKSPTIAYLGVKRKVYGMGLYFRNSAEPALSEVFPLFLSGKEENTVVVKRVVFNGFAFFEDRADYRTLCSTEVSDQAWRPIRHAFDRPIWVRFTAELEIAEGVGLSSLVKGRSQSYTCSSRNPLCIVPFEVTPGYKKVSVHSQESSAQIGGVRGQPWYFCIGSLLQSIQCWGAT